MTSFAGPPIKNPGYANVRQFTPLHWTWTNKHPFTRQKRCGLSLPFNGPLPGTTRVSRYQQGKTNLDFTEARDSKWQWHHLGHMQVCTSLHHIISYIMPEIYREPITKRTYTISALQKSGNIDKTDNHDSTPPLSFLQAGCPSCRPTNSVKALKA